MKPKTTFAAIIALAGVTSAWAADVRIGDTEYLTLDDALVAAKGGDTIELLADVSLTNSASVTTSVTIAGTNAFSITAKSKSVFVVSGGATLCFTNCFVTSKIMGSSSMFTVENSSTLKFGCASGIYNIGLPKGARAVCVNSGGKLVMEYGSAITNCTKTSGSTEGGAVYLSSGASFEFLGGTISKCKAGKRGGAVYAESGSELTLSGTATAYDNSKTSDYGNNIYLADSSILKLAGSLTGGKVGVYASGCTTTGAAFGSATDTGADGGNLFNEANGEHYAAISGSSLIWRLPVSGPQPVAESEGVVKLVNSDGTKYYASVSDGFAAATNGTATLTLLKNSSLTNSVSAVTDMTFAGGGYTLTRASGSASIAVTNVAVRISNLTISGGDSRVFDVYGGSLTLDSGAGIKGVASGDSAFVAPVVVWGGTFTMNSGAAISGCTNSYARVAGGPLVAGAVSVTSNKTSGVAGKAVLAGGSVSGCSSAFAGGIYIGNEATVDVEGDVTVWGNKALSLSGGAVTAATNCNLLVHDKSGLVLAGTLTGKVGYTEGIRANENKFGTTSISDASSSAAKFIHDTDGATGKVDSDGTTLIWGEADSSYDPGEEYAGEAESVNPEEPLKFTAIKMETDGSWSLTLAPGTGYCSYTIYTSDDLTQDMSSWTSVTNVTPEADGAITVVVESSSAKRFWYATGAAGTKPAGE